MNAEHLKPGHAKPALRSLITIVFAFLLSKAAASGDPAGAAFLKTDPSVRSFALGERHPVLNSGCQALGSNPANLSRLTNDFEIASSYAKIIGDTHFSFLALALQPWPSHFCSLQITHTLTTGMQARDTLGTYLNDFSAYDYAIGVSWSREMYPRLRTGATLKLLQSGIEKYNSSLALAADLGVDYQAPFAEFGCSLSNLGWGMQFIHESDPLPLTLSLGASAPAGPLVALVSMHYYPASSCYMASLGAEYPVLEMLKLRLGYRIRTEENPVLNNADSLSRALDGLTLGLGVVYKRLRFDYGFSSAAAEWGFSHRFALTWGWDQAALPDPTPAVQRRLKK